jgi:WD40 repeat protein
VVASTATGKRVATLPVGVAHIDGRPLVALSADGERVAAAASDSEVVLWDVRTRRVRARQDVPSGHVTAIAFGDGGDRLSIGTSEGVVLHVDVASDRAAGPAMVAHTGDVVDVAESVTGGREVSIGVDGLVVEHAPAGGDLVRPVADDHDTRVTGIGGAGDRVVVARADGAVEVVGDDDRLDVLLRATSGDTHVAFDRDGTALRVASADGAVREWRLAAPDAKPRRLGSYAGSPLALSPDGTRVAAWTAHETGDVLVQRLDEDAGKPFIAPLPKRPLAADFSPDATRVAVAFSDGAVDVLDAEGPADDELELTGHQGAVNDVAYRPDGTVLASVGTDGTLRFWNSADGHADGGPLGSGVPLLAVAFLDDGRIAATLGDDALQFWDVARRVPIGNGVPFPYKSGAALLEAAKRGTFAVVSSNDMVVRVDDLLWTSDRQRLAARVCQLVGRSLTRAELAQFEPDVTYHEQCHGTQPVAG